MKKNLLILLISGLLCGLTPLRAQTTTTVADGSATNSQIPIYGLYMRSWQHTQIIYPENMLANIWRTNGVIFAQRVMNALIGKGLSREKAYDTVQPLAMKAWSEGLDYKTLLQGTEKVTGLLSAEELDGCFTLDYYFKNVDYIFNRVGIA